MNISLSVVVVVAVGRRRLLRQTCVDKIFCHCNRSSVRRAGRVPVHRSLLCGRVGSRSSSSFFIRLLATSHSFLSLRSCADVIIFCVAVVALSSSRLSSPTSSSILSCYKICFSVLLLLSTSSALRRRRRRHGNFCSQLLSTGNLQPSALRRRRLSVRLLTLCLSRTPRRPQCVSFDVEPSRSRRLLWSRRRRCRTTFLVPVFVADVAFEVVVVVGYVCVTRSHPGESLGSVDACQVCAARCHPSISITSWDARHASSINS